MKITVRIKGKDKVFTTDFIPGSILRRGVEIMNDTDLSNINTDTLDRMVDFVVDAFNKQFTRDEFYDGVEAAGMMMKILSVINGIIESAGKALGADDEDPNSQQKA